MSSEKQLTEAAEPAVNEGATETKEEPVTEQSDDADTPKTDEDKPKTDEAKSKKKEKPKLTEKQKTVRAIRRLIIKIALIAIVATVLLTVVGSVAVSHDNNMFPAVGDGDLLITYKLGGYYNGDIVVYEVDGVRRIGRVVGIPGDEIDINNEAGYYTINGTMPYETIYFAPHRRSLAGRRQPPQDVPQLPQQPPHAL